MHQTYQEFLAEFLSKIKQLLKEEKVTYEDLQRTLGVNSKRSLMNILNGRRVLDLESFRQLCNLFDLWPEWNIHWDITWVVDGELQKVANYYGGKEELEKTLLKHARENSMILTKDVDKGYYFFDNKRLYIKRIKHF